MVLLHLLVEVRICYSKEIYVYVWGEQEETGKRVQQYWKSVVCGANLFTDIQLHRIIISTRGKEEEERREERKKEREREREREKTTTDKIYRSIPV